MSGQVDIDLNSADKCQISSRVTVSLACMQKTPPYLKLYQDHALITIAASTDAKSAFCNGIECLQTGTITGRI